MFLKPSSCYKYRGGFNIRLSVITKLNHEIQEQWHLAPMLVYDSIHPRACSQNIGAFHLVYWPWTYLFYFFCFEWQFSIMNILILLLLLFHFYFYFHFIIKMFCFVLKIKKYSSMKKKIILRFTFTSFSIQNN